jgi:hypothetical protein
MSGNSLFNGQKGELVFFVLLAPGNKNGRRQNQFQNMQEERLGHFYRLIDSVTIKRLTWCNLFAYNYPTLTFVVLVIHLFLVLKAYVSGSGVVLIVLVSFLPVTCYMLLIATLPSQVKRKREELQRLEEGL